MVQELRAHSLTPTLANYSATHAYTHPYHTWESTALCMESQILTCSRRPLLRSISNHRCCPYPQIRSYYCYDLAASPEKQKKKRVASSKIKVKSDRKRHITGGLAAMCRSECNTDHRERTVKQKSTAKTERAELSLLWCSIKQRQKNLSYWITKAKQL